MRCCAIETLATTDASAAWMGMRASGDVAQTNAKAKRFIVNNSLTQYSGKDDVSRRMASGRCNSINDSSIEKENSLDEF